MEVNTTVSMLDLSFVWNLHEGEKMKLGSKLTHSMFKAASILSLVSSGQGDVLARGIPTKGGDTWKWIFEAMELRYSFLQKDLIALHEEVKLASSLLEGENINNPFHFGRLDN